MTAPATSYVAEFTREVARAKVLSARRAMTAGRRLAASPASVAAETKIAAIAPR